jgi:hypothetical protein
MRLIAQVVGELDLHRALNQPLRQLREQAPGADDLLLAVSAGEQFVEHLARQRHLDPVRQIRHPGRDTSLASAGVSLRSSSGLAPRNASGTRVLHLHLRRCRHESPFDSVPTQKPGHSLPTRKPGVRPELEVDDEIVI